MSQRIEFNLPDKFDNFKGSFSGILLVVFIILLIWAGVTSIYTVQAESQGVVLRFGKYIGTVEPGLKFKLPFGIDEVTILPVQRQLKQEFGFGTPGASDDLQFSSSRTEQALEKSMVTGDLNAASVEWIVQYRIVHPELFLFKVRGPRETLRSISESVMRTVIGDRTVDEVITVGREEIVIEAQTLMQDLVNKYELGLTVDQVQLIDVNPPEPVRQSFNEVNRSQQERESMINAANGEYNKVIPRARGIAYQSIQAAEGYALKRTNEAEGDVARFRDLFTAYMKAPEVTKRRVYLETMQRVIPQMGRKIIIDSDANQILPLLQLGAENVSGGAQ